MEIVQLENGNYLINNFTLQEGTDHQEAYMPT